MRARLAQLNSTRRIPLQNYASLNFNVLALDTVLQHSFPIPSRRGVTVKDAVQLEVDAGIARVSINRPKAMNAIHPDIMGPLADALRRADRDNGVRVLVLSGVGEHFGAGYDLKADWIAQYGREPMGARQMLMDCMKLEFTPWDCAKPVIAMVRGYCLAGSCELAMMCCVTIASETAHFGEPEIRFSTSPPVAVMPWIVGLKKARELLYTGDIIDAQEALRIGMVNRVVADDMLEQETLKYAKRVAAISPEGLITTKAAINKGAEIAGFRQAMQYGVETGAILDSTETETYKKFNEIRDREGLPAAIRWREQQFE